MLDLGCGPFTAGLALAGQLGPNEEVDYIGIDRSRTMRRFGEDLASTVESIPEAPRVRRQWVRDIGAVEWTQAPGWRPVIVVVSFLLASPSLDAEALIGVLDILLSKLGRGVVTVLYTNSPRADPNRSFPVFRKALASAGFELLVDGVGVVETARGTRELRYALFRRPKQQILSLGEDRDASADLG